nr:unnamed protein product [Human coronavirus 229E]
MSLFVVYFALFKARSHRGRAALIVFKILSYLSTNDLYVALRGRIDKDLSLSRKVELYNGECVYLFCEHPAVGIVNTDFKLEIH